MFWTEKEREDPSLCREISIKSRKRFLEKQENQLDELLQLGIPKRAVWRGIHSVPYKTF
jgi:hypothetical protein